MAMGGGRQELLTDVAGTVTSYNPNKRAYVIHLQLHGDYLGNAFYDGNKLWRKIKGITSLSCFLDVNDQVFVTVEQAPSKRQRGHRVGQSDWVVTEIRPHINQNVKLSRYPCGYSEELQGRRHPIADLGYCSQIAENHSTVPKVFHGELISVLRNEISKWNRFPLHELRAVFEARNKPPYSYLAGYLGYDAYLRDFLRAYPQYFVLEDRHRYCKKSGSTTETYVYLTRRFTRSDFETFLTLNRFDDGKKSNSTYELVDTMWHCRRVCDRLLRRAARRQTPLPLAVDCEGGCLGKNGDLHLIQLATPEGESFVFDVLATRQPEDMFHRGKLGLVLEHENIIKVFHNCRSDQAALFWQFGIILNNVFDTSIAFAIVWEQCNTTVEYVQPSLAKISDTYGYNMTMKNSYIADKMKYDHSFWARRPLTSDMLQYATDDVLCLVPLVFNELNRHISPLWRPLFNQRCREVLESARS